MATTIVTKYGSDAPAASDIVRGELAVDTENGRLYTENAAGAVVEIGLNPEGNVDVTGSVTADGLTVNPTTSAEISGAVSGGYILKLDNTHASSGNGLRIETPSTAANEYSLVVKSNNGSNNNLVVSNNGDLSLYEDTGTTAKLFWDASAERLSVPTLSITDGSITTTAAAGDHTVFNSTGADADFRVRTGANTHSLYVQGNTGNVGIGESAPSNKLHVTQDVDAVLAIEVDNQNTGASSAAALYLNGQGNNFYLKNYGDGTSNANITEFISTAAGSQFVFATASAEAMRIDSGGNVGIGTTSPTEELTVGSGGSNYIGIGGDGVNASGIRFYRGASTVDGLIEVDANEDMIISMDNTGALGTGQILFKTGATERMRLDSSGNFLVGCTSLPSASEQGTGISDYQTYSSATSTSNRKHKLFFNGNGEVGSISTDGSATTYNTSSDQRLKENIADADDAGSKVDAIQVRKFDWIADGSHQDYGMIAQELQTVAPEAVTEGETEEDMMGVDYSKLVPMMLKEIQSLRARVAQLES